MKVKETVEDSPPKSKGQRPVDLLKYKRNKVSYGIESAHPFKQGNTGPLACLMHPKCDPEVAYVDFTKKKVKGKGGGEPPNTSDKRELMQLYSEPLRLWLEAYSNIPNPVRSIDSKARSLRQSYLADESCGGVRKHTTENMKKDCWHRRLSSFNPSIGWHGHRAPTVVELVTYSRRIASRLGDYEVDPDTYDFLVNNIGARFLIDPRDNPHIRGQMSQKELDCPFPVGLTTGVIEIGSSDWFIINDELIESLTKAWVRSTPLPIKSKVKAPAVDIATSSNTGLCLMVETPRAVMKRSFRSALRWQDPLLENQKRYKQHAQNYKDELFNEEFKYFWDKTRPSANDDSVNTGKTSRWHESNTSLSPVNVAISMANKAYFETTAFLIKGVVKKVLMFVDIDEPINKNLCEEYTEPESWHERQEYARYNQWFNGNDEARYQAWLLSTMPLNGGPEVAMKPTYSAQFPYSLWNVYVIKFNQFSAGEIERAELERYSYNLWKALSKKEETVTEQDRWANLIEDEPVEGEVLPKAEMSPYEDYYLSSLRTSDSSKRGAPTDAPNAQQSVNEEVMFFDVPSSSDKEMSFLCLKQAHKRLASGLFVPMDEYQVIVGDKTFPFGNSRSQLTA